MISSCERKSLSLDVVKKIITSVCFRKAREKRRESDRKLASTIASNQYVIDHKRTTSNW